MTLTTAAGGSLTAIGSAAGVAPMGVGGGHHTLSTDRRWTPMIALGFVGGVAVDLATNGA